MGPASFQADAFPAFAWQSEPMTMVDNIAVVVARAIHRTVTVRARSR